MWKKFPPTDWRSIDPLAFNYFSTLLTSRINIFLYGLNGIGKTKFAKNWLDENGIDFCYVDCLEHYNEKLMCYTITRQLTLYDKKFKDSKTFVALKDNLLTWHEHRCNKDKPLYIVLDNVERIMWIERVKKNLEKIFIVADMVAPLVSVLIIHDTYVEEVEAFSKSLFNEYNFTPFVLNPMDKDSMREVIKEKYFNAEPDDPNKARFDDFYNFLYQNFSKQTVNLKKWIFVTKLLFKVYWTTKYKPFSGILTHVSKHFYSNIVDLKDIEDEIAKIKEDKNQKSAEDAQQQAKLAKSINKFKPNKVTFFDEIKNGNKTSYTFIEALILLSAYLAAHNKESGDEINFSTKKVAKSKKRGKKNDEITTKINFTELGKTKKFSMERMLTILQYFIAFFCQGSEEAKLLHHSINVYSKINTFVSENLFKRSQGRNEDPSAISLKINYDRHMVEEVMQQFPNIEIADYLESK